MTDDVLLNKAATIESSASTDHPSSLLARLVTEPT